MKSQLHSDCMGCVERPQRGSIELTVQTPADHNDGSEIMETQQTRNVLTVGLPWHLLSLVNLLVFTIRPFCTVKSFVSTKYQIVSVYWIAKDFMTGGWREVIDAQLCFSVWLASFTPHQRAHTDQALQPYLCWQLFFHTAFLYIEILCQYCVNPDLKKMWYLCTPGQLQID